LLTFARKPAPIQVAWVAYPGTTGLKAMDYLVADRQEIPPGSEKHYCERVWRLPDCYACFDPPVDAPDVGPLPSASSGCVSFGSFNNPLKISAATTAVWGAILRRVPGARLRLKYFGLDNEIPQRRTLALLAKEGVAAHRVHFEGGSSHAELLAAYQQVDVALDTTPYSGGLTTCDALWMGVPVITCPGATFAGRHSASHLSGAGLDGWIAKDAEQCVALAVDLASDLDRLAKLRAGLRERLLGSALCDGHRLAGHLERLVREAWLEWVDRSRNT
jgi:predicted O-linked N-acetylglucosamine transferase (SPINDLY family)